MPQHVRSWWKLTFARWIASRVLDHGCVKTLRGITAPGILGSTVMRRAKKRKNLSSARRYDQIRFRFHTTKNQSAASIFSRVSARSISFNKNLGGTAD